MTSQLSQLQSDETRQATTGQMHADANRSPEASKKEDGKKKRFFGLLKRKESDKSAEESNDIKSSKAPTTEPSARNLTSSASPPFNSPSLPMTPTSNPKDPKDGTISPRSPLSSSASPSRVPYRSSSPRLLSPASSLIFERSVQDNNVPDDLSSSVPSHIQTEHHIPPVLEASSKAITDDHLDPSEVEIVTHSLHMHAAATVAAGTSHSEQPMSPTLSINQQPSDLADPLAAALEDSSMANGSSYGDIDTADVRRLSFISFADVVQGEHAESYPTGSLSASSFLAKSPSSPIRNRSPSPLRSPASSSGPHPFATSAGSSTKGIPIGRSPPVPLSPEDVGMSGMISPVPSELVTEKMSSALKAVETVDLHENSGR